MRHWLARAAPSQVLARVAALLVLLGAVTVAVPVLTDVGLLLATAASLAVVAVLVQAVVHQQQSLDWSRPEPAPRQPRGADSRVSGIRHRLEQAAGGNAERAAEVHRLLTRLAEERLRDHHGLDRAVSPAEAERLLGPDLTAYLSAPPGACVPLDRLDTLVTQLEELS